MKVNEWLHIIKQSLLNYNSEKKAENFNTLKNQVLDFCREYELQSYSEIDYTTFTIAFFNFYKTYGKYGQYSKILYRVIGAKKNE